MVEFIYKPLNYIGSSWSLWTPYEARQGFNFVTGTAKLVSDIISVCLIQAGGDFIHYAYGAAPLDLFLPLSAPSPFYWAYNLEQELITWVDLKGVSVKIQNLEPPDDSYATVPDVDNALRAEITFVPFEDPSPRNLTFPWFQYQGMLLDPSTTPAFLESVKLDTVPVKFQPLRLP